MKPELRNKKFGFKRFLKSFKYSFQGLKYAYLNEQSMFIHALCTILAVFLGIILSPTKVDFNHNSTRLDYF